MVIRNENHKSLFLRCKKKKAQKFEKIEETNISIEELQDVEIGGNYVQTLYPESISGSATYTVKSAEGVKTTWGVRVDYCIVDDSAEWRISSWNLILKAKVRPLDLVGKKIKLSPMKIGEKIKLLAEVLQ